MKLECCELDCKNQPKYEVWDKSGAPFMDTYFHVCEEHLQEFSDKESHEVRKLTTEEVGS